ncbi:phosphotransferase family protein [Streptomyces sp. enrichment culture]|uniref:phosphotransferase family protein n=1 Tax=Streptomyces sp. enrichment culture TaxID=1795815 RepID=UPI003F57E693
MLDVSQHVDWARSSFPFPPGATYPGWELCTTDAMLGARLLAVAYSLHHKRRPVDAVRQKLGEGLTKLGLELERLGRGKHAALAFQVGHLVLLGDPDAASPHDPKITRDFDICVTRLKDLGEPLLRDLPPLLDEPIWDLSEILASVVVDGSVARAPASTLRAVIDDTDESDQEPEEREEEEDDSSDAQERVKAGLWQTETSTARELVDELAEDWSSGLVRADERCEALLTYFREVSGYHGGFDRELGERLREDLTTILAYFPDGIPSDLRDLQHLARCMRAFAGSTDALDERRLRWLISATANHWMWKVDNGLPTNRPHVLHDLMGYLRAFLTSNLKFMDPARDLILDCAEILLRVAHGIPPVFLDRYPKLRYEVLSTVGTYLMLAGPTPALPQESSRDPRVYRAGQKPNRSMWPELLLRRWQADGSRNGACFALACVAGWDEACAHWVIDAIFDRPKGPEEGLGDDPEWQGRRGEWKEGVSTLLAAAGKVRVRSNPWEYDKAANSRGTSLVTGAGGAVRIPSPVLRAAVAQGLSDGEVVTVHGWLFEGRRMPTYLLTTRYGPRSVLKIDRRDKVLREESNFRQYAKRLHPNNRPSDCIASAMEMYLGGNGDPLRAIETAYAFEQGEVPRTLSDWIRTASPDKAVETINGLLLTNMRPWLAHSHRDRIDLRAEYPVFRPAPAPRKQSPTSWAKTELKALTKASVQDELGIELTPEKKSAVAWSASAPGLLAAMERLPGVETVNPLWFAAELSETGQGAFDKIINSFEVELLDFDTTLALAHGDLHLDNVLCTLSNEQPKPVLIDFESAHVGHVCKDFARLEASLLCQVFTWENDAAGRVASWVACVLAGSDDKLRKEGDLLPRVPRLDDLTPKERLVLSVTRRVREIAVGCGQGHWPIKLDEYHLALAGALLPMVRYTTLSPAQRKFALTLSTVITSALWHQWSAAVGTGN